MMCLPADLYIGRTGRLCRSFKGKGLKIPKNGGISMKLAWVFFSL